MMIRASIMLFDPMAAVATRRGLGCLLTSAGYDFEDWPALIQINVIRLALAQNNPCPAEAEEFGA